MHSLRSRIVAAAAAAGTLAAAAALTATAPAFAAATDTAQGFSATGAVQTWTVPTGVTQIYVDLAGGQGGASYGGGGGGAELTGMLSVTPGETLHIIAGSAGGNGAVYQLGAGGGGGSFIYTTADQDGLLAAAGGGGGAGSNTGASAASTDRFGTAGGNGGGAGGASGGGGQSATAGGGGGLLGDGSGASGGRSVANGAAGGTGGGGFGGGGSCGGGYAGGGGGGYSGGGGGLYSGNNRNGGGGGGGSYFAGSLTGAVNNHGGNGFVTIYYPSYLTSLAPATGDPGDSLTIDGSGLAGASVTIGGVAAAVTSSSDTQLVVTVPAQSPVPAAALTVDVETAGGVTLPAVGAFTYRPAPTVASVAPPSGSVYGGTTVTITGSHFTGASAVDFGDIAAHSYTVNSDTSITAVTPPASSAGAVDVTVSTAAGVSVTSAADRFAFTAPTITLSPATVPEGKQGVAYSQSLSASGGQGSPYTFALTAGALPDGVTLASNGTLSGMPTVNGSFDFTVTATSPDHYSGSADYTLEVASSVPTITGVSPAIGAVGDAVTIAGTDLDGASVTIGGRLATADPMATNSATSLTVLVPVLSVAEGTAVDVTATSVWGSATASDAFTYLGRTALVVTPGFTTGDRVDGAKVSIAATGFTPGLPVTAVVHSTPETVYSGTIGAAGGLDATAVLPALSEGGHELVVTAGTQEKDIWFAVNGAGIITAVSTTGPVTNPVAPSPSAGLAQTGSDVDVSLSVAAGLLLAGSIAVALALIMRRRRDAR